MNKDEVRKEAKQENKIQQQHRKLWKNIIKQTGERWCMDYG